MTNPEIQKLITEKIYPKYITEQIPEIRRDIPIWLKHCDKETAEKLKSLCEPYSQLSEKEREQQFPYVFWLSKNQTEYKTSPNECKWFSRDFSEFLLELENIVSGKEHDDTEREREIFQETSETSKNTTAENKLKKDAKIISA